MWFEIWAVTIALAIGFVVTAQIIERHGDTGRFYSRQKSLKRVGDSSV